MGGDVQGAYGERGPGMIRPIPQSDSQVKEVMTKSGHKDIHTDKWKRCVDKVKARGGGVNAYAVCTSSLGDNSFKGK